MKYFEERINLKHPLETLSIEICKRYSLGDFIDNNLIEIGYEDYNYILTTTKGKYVVKVFSNERTDDMAFQLAKRATVAFENGVSCPKIFKTENDESLLVLTIGGVKFRILVMEYIEGKDFYSLKVLPNEIELEKIATQLAKLNNIDYRPNFIYDRWAIVNYKQEYDKNIYLVEDEDKPLVDLALKAFNSCDFTKLKYGFVHGDIIETNVIRNKNGEMFFIDFSVSNYLPRIVDLAVTICDLCLDLDNINESKIRSTKFINAYEKVSPLSDYERECLKKFIVCHQAITIIETTREKKIEKNDSQENEIFLQKGKRGLRIVLEDSSIKQLMSEV